MRRIALSAICLLLCSLSASSAEPPHSPKQQVTQQFARLPLSFEANRGQAAAEVRFLARADQYTVWATARGAVLRFKDAGRTMQLQFAGAESPRSVNGESRLPGKVHYLIGSEPSKWHTDVPTFGRVRYRDVYPGIDVLFYGSQRQLEYDFVVSAGADPAQIRLRFAGADHLGLDDSGDLVADIGSTQVRWRKPRLYQKTDHGEQLVAGQYSIDAASGEAGFKLGSYDRSKELIIDPVLVYSSFLGGSGDDFATSVAVDDARHVYLTGITSSPDFPVSTGAYQPAQRSIFVSKLSADGSTLLYSTYLGGTNNGQNDYAVKIAVDSAGNAYIAGDTAASDFPMTFHAGSYGAVSGFVVKLDASGSHLVYSALLSATPGAAVRGLALDAAGEAFVVGDTDATDFPTTPGAYQTSFHGIADLFVTKLNSAGSALVYSTYLGGKDFEEAGGIDVDSAGNAYIAAQTISLDYPTTPGVFQRACKRDPRFTSFVFCLSGVVTKLNATGTALVYSTYLGGGQPTRARGVKVFNHNSYLFGDTMAPGFPTTSGAAQRSCKQTSGLCSANWVAELNSTGSGLMFSTFVAGSNQDNIEGMVVDSAGNSYVAGMATSADFPMTANALQPKLRGNSDAFVTKLSPAGGLVYSSYMGGRNDVSAPNPDGGVIQYPDAASAIALDGMGDVYITGVTGSTDFPTTTTAYQRTFKGGLSDAFVAKIGFAAADSCSLSRTDRSITFCGPANNAVQASPVHVIAGATDSHPVAFTQVFVDGKFQTQQAGPTMDVTLRMSHGPHKITVQAKDAAGYFKSVVYIAVQ